jgi:hypothetical protein
MIFSAKKTSVVIILSLKYFSDCNGFWGEHIGSPKLFIAGRGLQPRPKRFNFIAGRGLQPRPKRFNFIAGRGLQPRPKRFNYPCSSGTIYRKK